MKSLCYQPCIPSWLLAPYSGQTVHISDVFSNHIVHTKDWQLVWERYFRGVVGDPVALPPCRVLSCVLHEVKPAAAA